MARAPARTMRLGQGASKVGVSGGGIRSVQSHLEGHILAGLQAVDDGIEIGLVGDRLLVDLEDDGATELRPISSAKEPGRTLVTLTPPWMPSLLAMLAGTASTWMPSLLSLASEPDGAELLSPSLPVSAKSLARSAMPTVRRLLGVVAQDAKLYG